MIETIFHKALIDVVVAFIMMYALYYRRYRNQSLFAGALMLNVFVFCVMSIITDGDIALQAGLGLFAILSILRFRSENFDKMDMVYFFGGVAVAAVNGVATIGVPLFFANALILLVAWVADSALLSPRVITMKAELDYIPEQLFSTKKMKSELEKKLGVKVNAYLIRNVDYVKETVQFEIDYLP